MKYLPASFRSIRFPTESVEDSGGHNVNVLTPLLGKGSYVDISGRPSDEIVIKIPLYSPMVNEFGDDFSNLFPARLNELIEAMRDPSVGVLIHPIRGSLRVKPKTWSFEKSADVVNGTTLVASFIEHIEDQKDVLSFSSGSVKTNEAIIELSEVWVPPSETDLGDLISDVAGAAGEITGAINSAVSSAFEKVNAITDSVNEIASIGSSIASVASNTAMEVEKSRGKVDQIAGKARRMKDQIARAGNTIANATELSTLADIIIESSQNIKLANADQSKPTGLYFVAVPMTLIHLSKILNNSTEDLRKLNPGLGRFFFVPINTKIVYYRQ
jgi:prophage DNA circulation protein